MHPSAKNLVVDTHEQQYASRGCGQRTGKFGNTIYDYFFRGLMLDLRSEAVRQVWNIINLWML